ncbi:cell division protein FtsX [Desulfurispirillum indicum]|nr:FtsX-like permease family protein [Desulfurispirillum indicum]
MLSTPLVTLVAILTISIALTCLILYQTFLHNLRNYIDYRIDGSRIVVYMHGDRDGDLEAFLKRYNLNFRFIDHKEALVIFSQRYPDESDLLSAMEVNPLPQSYLVSMDSHNIQYFRSIINGIKSSGDSVLSVEYSFHEISVLLEALDLTERFRLIIGAFVVFVCAVMVSNTIRISYYKYMDDIRILRILGASSMFIKGPYFLEAFLIGVCSIAIAIGASLYSVYFLASDTSFLTILGSYALHYPTMEQVALNSSIVALLSVIVSMFTLRGAS